MVVQQHVMTRQMIFREINAPLEHVGVHGAGFAFMLAGNNLHPVATAESVVETHALEGIGLVGLAQEMLVSFMDKRADVS